MTDTEILEEVYRRLNSDDPHGWKTNPINGVRSFIEQEWQKRDELDDWREDMFNLADAGQMYNADPCTSDIKEIEQRRGLDIGEDGTVKEIK